MSDGISDAAQSAEQAAREFIKKIYPHIRVVRDKSAVPATGKVVLLYEAWIDHIVEMVIDRKVIKRFRIKPFDHAPRREPINRYNYDVGGIKS